MKLKKKKKDINHNFYVISAQQFDADLFAEESAQTKYYEMKASARPFIEPKLVPQQKLMQMASHDNISIHSAPTLTRSTSGGHHVMTASPPPAVRLRKWTKGHNRLANSASTNSLTRKSLPTSGSQTSLMTPRPKSYVPFQGCVETPSPLPGRAARDILHALSYAPTHESFSAQTQQSCAHAETQQHHQPKIISDNHRGKHGSSRASNYPLLKSKSSSFASLMCHQGVPDDKIFTAPPLFMNPLETAMSQSPVMYVQTELEPIYAPTNPMNHPENRAVFNAHPPVIYPPPDLVPSPGTGVGGTPVKQVSSPYSSKSPGLMLVMTGSPGLTRSPGIYAGYGSANVVRRSNASLGSPGLSSASGSSGFETARSSSSSSVSSIMFDMSHVNMAGGGPGLQNPGGGGGANILESIRETSPMTSTSVSRF